MPAHNDGEHFMSNQSERKDGGAMKQLIERWEEKLWPSPRFLRRWQTGS